MGSVVRKREYVYAASVRGTWQRVHRWSGLALQVILFATPWIVVGDHPALLVDLPHRRLFAFGHIFGATDTIYLVLIGLFLAFSLFFMTALLGRLWCGYLCPQTVFLEEWVRRIEIGIEGERGKRRARDQGPWTWDKAWRKAAKWTAFLALALVVSMTLVSYFAGARPLWTGQAGAVSYGFVAFFTGVLYWDFAWFREQLCNYVCPYARFQGALTDDHSLTVAYDARRGEPRGLKAEGACIDCGKCAMVCPNGIDIRDGFQLECINCARCVDACAGVMEKRGGQPGLVQYTTLARTEGRKTRIARPRTFVYSGLLAAIATVFLVLLQNHHTIDASVARAPGTLFAVDPDGAVRNTFLLRVANNHPDTDGAPDTFRVTVEGLPGAEVLVQDLSLQETESATIPLVIRVPEPQHLDRTVPLTVRVRSPNDEVELKTTFKTADSLGGPGA